MVMENNAGKAITSEVNEWLTLGLMYLTKDYPIFKFNSRHRMYKV